MLAHHGIERGGGAHPDALAVRSDAGERWIRQLTEDFVVVDPQHRKLVWYGDVQFLAETQDLAATQIVSRQHAGCWWERLQPVRQGALFDKSGRLQRECFWLWLRFSAFADERILKLSYPN